MKEQKPQATTFGLCVTLLSVLISHKYEYSPLEMLLIFCCVR